jgi:hypothetical protein
MTDPSDFERDDESRPRILDNLTQQRSARNDPSMRDGDSGRGNPNESGADPDSTDADVGDAAGVEFDTDKSELVREGVPVEPEGHAAQPADAPGEPGLSADAVGALVEADDRSDQNHALQTLPIDGYQHLTVPQIVAKLDTLSPGEVRAVREYEAAHRKRKTLLTQLDRHLKGARRSAAGS